MDQEFYYVYRVTRRPDGLLFFLQHTERRGWCIGWTDERDCQRYVDSLRTEGHRVEVMDSAQPFVS